MQNDNSYISRILKSTPPNYLSFFYIFLLPRHVQYIDDNPQQLYDITHPLSYEKASNKERS